MSLVEFCSGYGGATAGLLAAGLEIEMTYDLWPVAVEQHRNWHPEVPCKVRDISTVSAEELRDRLVWASLPCQPWSTANIHPNRRGKNHAHYYSLAHFARQVQFARCALIENVPGLVHTKQGQAELAELEQECAILGLTLSVHLVFSHWFGVPQKRRRVFILIGRDLPLILLHPTKTVTPLSTAVTCHDGGDNIHSSRKNRLTADHDRATEGAGRSIEYVASLQGVPVPSPALTKKDRFTLVGNCVPPLLAEQIARQVFLPLVSA